MTVELVLGDCLEAMKAMPSQSCIVVTDPPYGIDFINGGGRSEKSGWRDARDDGDWDKYRPDKEYFEEMLRIGTKVVIWGGNYFTDYLPPTMQWFVWDKCQRDFSLADCELAWSNQQKASRVFSYPRGAMQSERVDHPTQKPLALMKWCIELVSAPGDLVFDPYLGSGTTGAAAIKIGRQFKGCEIRPKYHAIAVKRIQDAQAQPLLLEAI